MNCPNCQTENPEQAKFCFNCGMPLALTCSSCATELPTGAKFCFNCGTPTAAAAEQTPTPVAPQPLPSAPPIDPQQDLLQRYIPKGLMNKLQAAQKSGLVEGERRVVTILFCDLKGSTMAASGLDPEEWSEIINGAFQHMIEPVYRYEGTVARLMGDGLLAFFGAPIAHEDDPQRAVLAGLDIVQAVNSYSAEVEKTWGLPLAVRVGINTGLVVVGAVGSNLRMEYTALGDAINLAARMEQTAEPGTVQIAAPTHKLIAPLFDFQALGGLQIKGINEAVQAYRVLGAKAAPGRLRGIAGLNAPLIGRQEQLSALQEALDGLNGGRGQIVSVMGEAGLGKSRLVSELQQAQQNGRRPAVRWLEGKSQSYQTNVPYTPFKEIFNSYFEFPQGQTSQEKTAHIEAQIDKRMPGQGADIAPFLATMLDLELDQDALERIKFLEPPQLRGRLFANVKELLQAHLAQEALVIFLDDLHWVDPTSQQLLEYILPLVEERPLLIIAAFRPRRHEPSWRFHEMAQRDYNHSYSALNLSPLDSQQSQQLVSNLLSIEDLPQEVRQTILDRSEGNPFFVEEIIRSMLDQGLIVPHNGHWRVGEEIGQVSIPDTVMGVISARLDALEEDTRQIAQAASVLGREFTLDILTDIAEAPQAMDEALRLLQQRELIHEKRTVPKPTFLFKHVLTQEAAYNSILLSNRRELHRRAVQALLKRTPDQPAAIAAHCLQARMQTRAVPYLVEAGNHAARAYASEEALQYYEQAIELRDMVDDMQSLRQAYEGRGQILLFTQQVGEAVQNFEAMLALGQAKDDMTTQISALNKLASTYAMHMGQFQKGDQYLAQADALVTESDDQSGAAESALIRCQMCTMQADFHGVITHMSNLVEVGQALGSKEYMSMGLEHVSSSLVWLTRFDEAKEIAQEALTISREIGDREHEAMVLTTPLPYCALRDGDLQGALDFIEEGVRVAQKIGAVSPQILGNWLAGDILQMRGEYEKGMAFGNRALDIALPMEEMMPWMVVLPLGSLGSAYLHISDQLTDEIARFHVHATELLRSDAGAMVGGAAWAELGYCSLALGDLDLAEDSFQKGLNNRTLFVEVERPRLLAGTALLALERGDRQQAYRLAQEAFEFAQERKMRHILPFAHLTLGQIQGARGEVKDGLEQLSRAEELSLAVGLRPIVWKSRLAMAELLQENGRTAEAQAKREEAQQMVQEIAHLIEDQTLRETYLRHMSQKLNSSLPLQS